MSQSQRRQQSQIAVVPPGRNQQKSNGRDMWDQVQVLLGLRVARNSTEMFATYYKRYDPYWSSNPRFVLFFPEDLPPRPLCSLPAFPKHHGQAMASAVATMQRPYRSIPIAHPRPSKILQNPSFLTMPLELASEPLFTSQHRTKYAAPSPGVSDTSSLSQIASVHSTPKLEPPATRTPIAGHATTRHSDGIESGAEIGVEARRPGPYVPHHRDPGLQRVAPHGPIAIPQNQYAHPRSAASPVGPSPRREVSTVEGQRLSVDSLAPTGDSTTATTETGKRKRKANPQTRATKKKPRTSVSRAS